jgi:hypothetical protein
MPDVTLSGYSLLAIIMVAVVLGVLTGWALRD